MLIERLMFSGVKGRPKPAGGGQVIQLRGEGHFDMAGYPRARGPRLALRCSTVRYFRGMRHCFADKMHQQRVYSTYILNESSVLGPHQPQNVSWTRHYCPSRVLVLSKRQLLHNSLTVLSCTSQVTSAVLSALRPRTPTIIIVMV